MRLNETEREAEPKTEPEREESVENGLFFPSSCCWRRGVEVELLGAWTSRGRHEIGIRAPPGGQKSGKSRTKTSGGKF